MRLAIIQSLNLHAFNLPLLRLDLDIMLLHLLRQLKQRQQLRILVFLLDIDLANELFQSCGLLVSLVELVHDWLHQVCHELGNV